MSLRSIIVLLICVPLTSSAMVALQQRASRIQEVLAPPPVVLMHLMEGRTEVARWNVESVEPMVLLPCADRFTAIGPNCVTVIPSVFENQKKVTSTDRTACELVVTSENAVRLSDLHQGSAGRRTFTYRDADATKCRTASSGDALIVTSTFTSGQWKTTIEIEKQRE